MRDDKSVHIILRTGTNDLRTESRIEKSIKDLVLMCTERNIPFISQSESIDSTKYLNESKLHLKCNGVEIFPEISSAILTKFD